MANPALQNYRYTPSQVGSGSQWLHSARTILPTCLRALLLQIVNTARSDAQQRLEVSQVILCDISTRMYACANFGPPLDPSRATRQEGGQLLLRSKQQHQPKVLQRSLAMNHWQHLPKPNSKSAKTPRTSNPRMLISQTHTPRFGPQHCSPLLSTPAGRKLERAASRCRRPSR